MAFNLQDRVKETTTTIGTGSFTLGGTSTGFVPFSAIGNGNETYYTAVDNTTGDWEVGIGTYNTGTLTRDTVLASSDSGNKVAFAPGSKDVFVAYPAEKAVTLDTAQTLSNKTLTAANLGTPTSIDLTNGTGLPLTTGVTGTLLVGNGGTGATTLTGYVKASGTSAFTAVASVPASDITGLGTMATQNASSVAITGGSINGTTVGASSPSTGAFTEVTVDNLNINGNTISSTDTNGNITLDPNGTGTVDVSSAKIVNVATPTNTNDGVNKAYVDTLVASGITYHTPVKYEVPTALTATYNQPGGAGVGVGATLTNAGTLAAFAPDGPTVASVGDRILIYNQASALQNGVYTVTTVGSGSVAWVLTRATDADTYALKSPNGLGEGDAFFVTSGSTGAGETYICNTQGTITFGSTSINFVQVAAAQVYSAGTGLTLTGTTFSITPVGTASTYGSASQVPVITTNASGQVSSVTNTNIAIANTAVSGLGTMSTQNANNVAITGGSINGTTIGASTASTGAFTTLSASSTVSGTGFTNYFASPPAIGGTAANTGAFTTLSASGVFTAKNGGSATTPDITTSGDTNTGIFFPAADTIAFCEGGSEVLRISSTGAFGLSGTNYGTSGQVITSNGSASAPTWQTPTAVNNGTLTMNVSGTGLSGSQTFTANQSGNATFTVTSNATNANTGSTIVARDASGNFSAGTITATLSGNASTVTDGMYLASTQTSGGRKSFSAGQSSGSLLNATGSLGGLEAVTPGGANAAFMSFHRAGAYASYFGIDTDNNFAVGGWSAGAALASMKVGSFGVGTAASGTSGEIRATNNITAYYSDARLKDFKGKIGDALYKVSQLNGYYYTENEKAEEFGYNNKELQVGVSAQEVQAVLPEVVSAAPFDLIKDEDGKDISKSGDNYMTVRYEKLVPLLIEAIKELKAEVEALKARK